MDWGSLAHAYGTGVTGPELDGDVARTLRRLADPALDALPAAMHALYAHTCHQGTIYPVTAHVVPFLAALAAGPAIPDRGQEQLVALLAEIAGASTLVTETGTSAGSYGPGVGPATRAALRASAAHLHIVADHFPRCAPLVAFILDLAHADPPAPVDFEALDDDIDSLLATDEA